VKRVTVRDLRNNFAKLEAWLGEGEQIQIRKRGQPIALLTAFPRSQRGKRRKLPDFRARRRAIWGDRVFSDDEVKAMRAAEREGEEG
jgi:antitoxin (DNA-binding transcriptional repressor) of toxin-antitoxin stability system